MTEQQKIEINSLLGKHSLREIARKLGVQLFTIRYHLDHGLHLNKAEQKRRDRGARPYRCSLCKNLGHNSQTCGVKRP